MSLSSSSLSCAAAAGSWYETKHDRRWPPTSVKLRIARTWCYDKILCHSVTFEIESILQPLFSYYLSAWAVHLYTIGRITTGKGSSYWDPVSVTARSELLKKSFYLNSYCYCARLTKLTSNLSCAVPCATCVVANPSTTVLGYLVHVRDVNHSQSFEGIIDIVIS